MIHSKFWPRGFKISLLLSSALLLSVGSLNCADSEHNVEHRSEGPTAAFTVSSTTARAGDILVFDASATTPDEAGLIFSWDFGNGKRGGNIQIAHIFADSGTFPVTLTVADSQGRTNTTQTEVTIEAVAFPAGDTQVSVKVHDLAGQPLEGVELSVYGSEISATTDQAGDAVLDSIPLDHHFVVRLTKDGFVDQFVRTRIAEGTNSPVIRATMQLIDDRVQLANIENGGTANSRHGARVVFPPNAIIDAQGNAVTGAIEVQITVYNTSGDGIAAFPGSYNAVNSAGEESILVTHGAMDVTLRRGDERLQIAPGKAAEIEIPFYSEGYSDGVSVELWSLDEASGVWIQEGRGTLAESTQSPTGLVLRGQATHFSVWNADTWINTPCELEVHLKCVDENNQLVDLPSDASGQVEVNVASVPGLGDPCDVSNTQRHVSSYRHGSTMPNGTYLEGQMCGGNNCQAEADILCKNATGQLDPNFTCKCGLFSTNPNGNSVHIGVCVPSSPPANHCPDWMYCDSNPASATYSKCTPPMYRHSNHIPNTSVQLFQRWTGFNDLFNVTNSRIVTQKVPRTTMTLTAHGLSGGGHDFTPTPKPVAPNPGGPPTEDMPLGLANLPDECTAEPVVWNVGACPAEAPVDPPEDCEPNCGKVTIVCDSTFPTGINDVPGYCELDAIIVERADGGGSGPATFSISSVTVDDGEASVEAIRAVSFTECTLHPTNGWGNYPIYFRGSLTVDFDEELKPGNILRIFRQGFPTNRPGPDNSFCAPSGTLTIKVNDRPTPIASDIYDNHLIRLTDDHF